MRFSWIISCALLAQFCSAGVVDKGPVRFEQSSTDSYVARGTNWSLSLTRSSANLSLIDRERQRTANVALRMIGARPGSTLEASSRLPGSTNYITGRQSWRTGIASYERVSYRNVYSGIDLAFHGGEGHLEYDFIVAPGANVRTIRFEFSGGEQPRLTPQGDLVIESSAGAVTWNRPVIYQESYGRRSAIPGGFRLDGRTVSFEIGPYDHAETLVIDPVLSYASYLGGSANEMARGIAVDSAGNIYVTGFTTSPDLAVSATAVQPAFAGQTASFLTGDAFVAKYTAAGALSYLTYLGGAADDAGMAIAVDSAGNAYITGSTNSPNFPVSANAYQKTFAGTGFGNSGRIRGGDAFVTKLSPDGSQLLYSTYLGGRFEDIGIAIAVDSTGAAYVAGATLSQNFPTTPGVFQAALHGGGGQPTLPSYGVPTFTAGDAFVAKLDPAGSHLAFSTLLGGSRDDAPFAIALDATGNVYIGGYTISSDFPITSGAFQQTPGGRERQSIFFNFGDGFVAKLNPTGTELIYSTYFGGTGDDNVMGLAIDASGNAYITGSTSSLDLPASKGAIQSAFKGYFSLPFLIEQLFGDAYVAKLNPSGSAVLYCTYLGGSVNDMGLGIAVDSTGNAFVAGWTDSTDFPVTNDAAQRAMAGDGGQQPFILFGDGFLSEIDPTGTKLLYSTYFGGSRDDLILGLASDGAGNIYVAGNTLSTNLPVSSAAAQAAYAGSKVVPVFLTGDAFVAKYTGFSSSAGNAPQLNAIANAASAANGPVSPGMLFVGYGTNIGPATLVYGTVASGRLTTSQSGISILFDGVPAPIVYVADKQVAGFVPYSLQGKQATQVVIKDSTTGLQSPALTLNVQGAAPGLFSINFTGHGQGAILNADTSPNSAANPAAKGSVVVVYATGEGQTNPPGTDGLIAGANPPKPQLPVTATVGGLAATIEYVGGAPQLAAGTLQVNIRMSPNVASGNQPVVVRVGSFQSQPNLTVAVK